MTRRVGGAALLAFGIAGCSGHTSPAIPAGTSGGTATSAHTRSVSMTLTIPDVATAAARRIPAYVSPSAANVIVTANPGAFVTNAALSNCTNVTGGRACSFAVTAPIGADTFTIVVTDTNSNPVSGGSNFAATITEGTANVSLPLILGGVVDHATVAVGTDAGPATGTRTIPVTVTAFDKDNNTIIGSAPFVNAAGGALPLTLTFGLTPADATDPQIIVNGVAQGGTANTVSVTSPSTTVGLQLAASQPTIGSAVAVTAGATTVPSATAYVHVTGGSTLSQTTTGIYGVFATANGLLASPPLGVSGSSYSVITSSNGEVIPIDHIFNVAGYCSMPSGGGGTTVVGGIAVASDGTFFATYRTQAPASVYTMYLGHFSIGGSNVPCTLLNSVQFSGAVANHNPGPVVLTGNLVFAVVNVPGPSSTQAFGVATTGLTGFTETDIPSFTGQWSSATTTADGSVWVADSINSQVRGFAGSSPSTFVNFTTVNITSSGSESVASDGTRVYVGNFAMGVDVLTPSGTNTPAQQYLSGTTFAKNGYPQSIAIGPDGRLYLLTSSGISVYDRLLGGSAIATLSDATAGAIATGADGDLWVNDASSASIGRIAQGVGI